MNPSITDERDAAESGRELISQITQTLATAIPVAEAIPGREPLTFADIVRTGAVFCKMIAFLNPDSGGRFTEEELQFVEDVLSNIDQPEALNAMLLARVDAGAEDAGELARLPQAIHRFMEQPYNVRQLLQKVIPER